MGFLKRLLRGDRYPYGSKRCLGCGHTFDLRSTECPKCGVTKYYSEDTEKIPDVHRLQMESKAANDLGVRLAQQGEFVKAVKQFRKAQRINPKNDTARENLDSLEREISRLKPT